MKRTLIKSVMVVLWVLCFTVPTESVAVDTPNILVVGEDRARGTVPYRSRVFKQVLNALSDTLHNEGFFAYDETAFPNMSRRRRSWSDADAINFAKDLRNPPIDIAVIFQIQASLKRHPHTTKIRTSVTGRLLDIHSGERLGNFEVIAPRAWQAAKRCGRECVLETIGSHAQDLAWEVGAVLSQKLHHLYDGGAMDNQAVGGGPDSGQKGEGRISFYSITFKGFSADKVEEFEESLVAFSGYRSHRPTEIIGRSHGYQYRSTIPAAKLLRNVRKMLGNTNADAHLKFADNVFVIKKIGFREEHQRKKDYDW
jgi:hypothetical protein